MLFVVSFGLSLSRVAEQYRAEARVQRNGLWIASQAQMETVRLLALVQRHVSGDPGIDAAAVKLQFEIMLSRIDMLHNGEGPTEYSEMMRLREWLPEIHAQLGPVETMLDRLLEGHPQEMAPVTLALEGVEALLLGTNLRLHLERQAAAEQAVGGTRSLHWTLLVCMVGLSLSAGLLITLLLVESRRSRRLLISVKDADQRQRQAERMLSVLIDSLPAMVSAYDAEGRYLFFNEAYGRFHALGDAQQAIGRRPRDMGLPADPGLAQVGREPGGQEGHGPAGRDFAEYSATDRDGRLRTLLAIVAPVGGEDDMPGNMVHVAFDISDRKAAEDRVRHLAEHDALTDLPNRVLFSTRLRQALEEAGRSGQGFALHCIDLDRFKEVNDSLGHHGGDRLLLAAAERMRACLRCNDTLARLGGDEFAVIQTDVPGVEDANRLSSRLVAVLALPFVIDGCTLHSGASIGSVRGPVDGRTAAELQQRADIALYRAKAEGRGRAVTFSPEMEAALVERRALETDLRLALEQETLHLVYQPQFTIGATRPNGCEALLRWNHPVRGMVSPAVFVPVAEDAGLALVLSRYVLRRACEQITAWRDKGLAIRVAVNLSALHFASNQAVTLVEEALAAAGAPATLLEVEVTEGVFIRNAAAARAALSALRARGVRVALDDFGTGYSSLSYLQHLPFDVVKLDRAFVQDLRPGESSSTRIVDAVVRLAHGLGARVVAEGVELPEQLEVLRRLGCDDAQGYLLGRPMPPAALAALFTATLPVPPVYRFAGRRVAARPASARLRGLDRNLTRP